MDVGKLLKNVHSLNEYISTTQDAAEKCKNSKILLNMSTVLALKKIRSLEIEYFTKYEENGIACIIFERMLCLPPSKTWGVLSKELVNLLQYWLDGIRKHLVRHNLQWWTFLKFLLRFVKEIRQKDSTLPNILVEHTAECLLDLATNSRPDATQRHEILHCFNMYCSESSREIRFALRNRLGQYFTKLSTYMATCGHLPTQYSILETLLRWLLPRQDRTLRITSAAKWFPPTLYVDKDVEIFLERPWVNFFQDARDFLNAHNQRQDLVTSVVCRKLCVGEVKVGPHTERQELWLDINSVTRCVSVLLDPRVLETFGSTNHKSFETLVVTDENTHTAKLHRESLQLVLSMRTVSPPRVLPSDIDLGGDVSCDVTAVVTSRCDVRRLDKALRKVFEHKYQVLLDLDKELTLSPVKEVEHTNLTHVTEDDARFSHPVEVKRRKHSGYIVRPRQPLGCISPSTASTSSLAQLHEKLAALPRYRYEKEPISVCALPELSIVTELSEADDKQSLNTTLKFKPYGVCYKNINKQAPKKAHTDTETRKSQSDPEISLRVRKGRRLSPVVNEDTTSCLLVATIGSADDSVINDTVERLSKSKDYNSDNIVDLLLKEALQTRHESRDKSDSGINTGEKKSLDLNDNSEAIDNTPISNEVKVKKVPKKIPKVVSSTSDESNTEAINETPCFVNTRKKNKKDVTGECSQRNSFDEQVVEEFFSQHFTENKVGEIVISPTLAKKINETSSETSDNFCENFDLVAAELDENIVPYDFNNIDVIECLNSMVDKVCDEFDKCSKYLNKDNKISLDASDTEDNIPLKDIINTIQDMECKSNKITNKSGAKGKIKLKYKTTPKEAKARTKRRQNKLDLEPTSKLSTIIEDSKVTTDNTMKDSLPIETEELKTPMLRRKRKLYSPKNDDQIAENSSKTPEDTAELKIKTTPKTSATCYKEIEKDRQRYIRMPRTRKSKKYEPPSPRTKKMNDIFDKVKESANVENVTLADKTKDANVYNFTSDSDDDFEEKKFELSKRNTMAIGSGESGISKRGRPVKRVVYVDKTSDESNKTKRNITRKPRMKKRINIEQNDLVDERMRQAKDVLNTSILVENTNNPVNDPELILKMDPEMEVIVAKSNENAEVNKKLKGKKIKAETARSKRVLKKPVVEIVKNFDDDRTESPLPGLLVEPATTNNDENNELSATMVDKFKKIYQEGPESYVNESNTTQNLLSDIERINCSPPNVDIYEEPIQIQDQKNTKGKELRQIKETPGTKKKSNNRKTTQTYNNTKKIKNTTLQKNKESLGIVNISDIDEISDKSIATIGITGHGELEEEPPSPKLINEKLEPRNLEVEDLDNSMKEYFDKLTKQMNESNNQGTSDSNKSVTACEIRKKNKSIDSVKSNSPVVSVRRLSLEDISRWLPSRRNSETDDTNVSTKSKNYQNNEKYAIIIISPENPKCEDNDSNTTKLIETQRKSVRLIFKTTQNSNNESKNCGDSDSESNNEKESSKVRKIKSKTIQKVVDPKKNKPEAKTPKKIKPTQKSVISPIKLFDDLISTADKQSETTLSEDEEYMKEIINTKDRVESLSKPKDIGQKAKSEFVIQEKLTKSIDSESSHSKIGTSTKKDDFILPLKRKSEQYREDFKKKKVEVNNNVACISGSGATASSIDDWFKRIEPDTSRTDVLNASVRHSMQHVMEKLDTTLVEIHRSTSKKFVHLFVDAQKHLCEQQEQRRGLYQQHASTILSEVVKIIDDKFTELDKRSQELDCNFMKKLKERASELIRTDFQQKQAMVRLLKEDVQAVVTHMDRQGI